MFALLVIGLLVSCFQISSSIRCYDCNSANNSMCLEPSKYDPESIQLFLGSTECEQGVYTHQKKDFFCRKITQILLYKGHDSEVRVTRGCGWKRHPKDRECYKADNEDHLETVCQCFHDHCNGAEGLKAVLLPLVVIISVLSY